MGTPLFLLLATLGTGGRTGAPSTAALVMVRDYVATYSTRTRLNAHLMIPAWAFAPSLPVLVIGAFAMQFMVQGAWGVIPAHITELAPDSVRGFLPGFAYQCGVLVAGTVVYLEALFAARLSYTWAMALTAGTVFVVCAIVAAVGPERRGVVYGTAARGDVAGV